MTATPDQLREAASTLATLLDDDVIFGEFPGQITHFSKTADQLLQLADKREQELRPKTTVKVNLDSGELIVRVKVADGWHSVYIGDYTNGYITQTVPVDSGETIWSNE